MIAKYFLFFIIYSFIGWAWECLISLVRDHKIVNRGFLNGPYCPIYGCGAILFLSLLHFTDNLAALFIVGGLLACILEYITSYAMEKLFHARWWDYRNYPLNINGRVCLYGFLIFGAGAVLISIAHPHIDAFVNNIENANAIAIVIATIFILDVITTNQGFAHFNKILREYQATLKKGRVVNFIERKGRRFVEGLSERRRRIFTYQQRRLMEAFPNFQSSYDRAYTELQKFYQKTKFKPEQSAHARKKSKKILK